MVQILDSQQLKIFGTNKTIVSQQINWHIKLQFAIINNFFHNTNIKAEIHIFSTNYYVLCYYKNIIHKYVLKYIWSKNYENS